MRKKDEIRREIVGSSPENSLPKIRRQVMRICEALGVDYNDLAVMQIEPGRVIAQFYERDLDDNHYLDSAGEPARNTVTYEVDTETFLGDERDI